MSVSIYFTELNKEKVDAAWKDVVSGNFKSDIQDLKNKQALLEQQMPALDAELEKYKDVDPDYIYYSKDPLYKDYEEAYYAKEKLRREIGDIKIAIISQNENLKELSAALASKDKQAIIPAIENMDSELVSLSSEKSFSDYVSNYEEFIEIMFMEVLGINILAQDYYETERITGIPFNLWVELFQRADSETMKMVRDVVIKAGYPFEEFTDAVLPIKDIVKFCHDTNTEMVVYYEGDPVPWQTRRAEDIYNKYYKAK